MFKTLAALLAALSLALTAPCLAADLPNHPFIHVEGSSVLHVMPDTGEIDFEIVSSDPDAEAAWKQVAQQLEAAKALLARQNIAAQDVSVQDILRKPRKSGDGGAPVVDTRCAVHVTVRDLSAWTALVQALIAVKQVESFAVSFSHSEREKIEAELVTQALASARAKAQNIARGIGARLGQANGVALAPLRNLTYSMGLASDGQRRSPPPENLDPGLIGVQKFAQDVHVLYRIGK